MVGCMDGSVICYDEKGTVSRRLNGHTAAVTNISNLNNRFVLTSSTDGSIRIWNQQLLTAPKPDGKTMKAALSLPFLVKRLKEKAKKKRERLTDDEAGLGIYNDEDDDEFTPKPSPKITASLAKFQKDKVFDKNKILAAAKLFPNKKPAPPEKEIEKVRDKSPPKKTPTVIKVKDQACGNSDDETPVVIKPKVPPSFEPIKLKPHSIDTTGKTPRSPRPQENKLTSRETPRLPPIDPTYQAVRDHHREMALINLAAEVAVERAMRSRVEFHSADRMSVLPSSPGPGTFFN